MVYRDDEFGKLRSKVDSLDERLESFERLYKERGFTKTFGRRVLEGTWRMLLRPIRKIWYFITDPFNVFISVLVIGLGVLICYAAVDIASLDDKREQEALEKCESFCNAHEYSFHEKMEDELCFCTQGDSEETKFIINVETSEFWQVEPQSPE